MTINYTVLLITFCFIVFDCISGFIQAFCNKSLSSTKMRDGLAHKGAFILVVVLAIMCEYAMMYIPGLGFQVPLVLPACAYIILTEVISIVENIGKMNPEIKGSKLLDLFKVSKED